MSRLEAFCSMWYSHIIVALTRTFGISVKATRQSKKKGNLGGGRRQTQGACLRCGWCSWNGTQKWQSESGDFRLVFTRTFGLGVKTRQRLPNAVHQYLALRTEFDIRGWERSPAKFEAKWRLALMIMQGIAKEDYVNSVFAGGTLYPLGGRDPVFCPECLNEMTQTTDDTWIWVKNRLLGGRASTRYRLWEKVDNIVWDRKTKSSVNSQPAP